MSNWILYTWKANLLACYTLLVQPRKQCLPGFISPWNSTTEDIQIWCVTEQNCFWHQPPNVKYLCCFCAPHSQIYETDAIGSKRQTLSLPFSKLRFLIVVESRISTNSSVISVFAFIFWLGMSGRVIVYHLQAVDSTRLGAKEVCLSFPYAVCRQVYFHI